MNSRELGIYTALKHREKPEEFRITDGGTKIWTIIYGTLQCFEGEGLDKMSLSDLQKFYQIELHKFCKRFNGR